MATPSFGSGAAIVHGHAPEDPEPTPDHAEIEVRAYFIYLEEGGGDPDEHWDRAKRELAGPPREREQSADDGAGDGESREG